MENVEHENSSVGRKRHRTVPSFSANISIRDSRFVAFVLHSKLDRNISYPAVLFAIFLSYRSLLLRTICVDRTNVKGRSSIAPNKSTEQH